MNNSTIRRLFALTSEQAEQFWPIYLQKLSRSIRLQRQAVNFRHYADMLADSPNRDGYSLKDRVKWWAKDSYFVTIDTDAENWQTIREYGEITKSHLWKYEPNGEQNSRYGCFRNIDQNSTLNLFYAQTVPLFEQFVKQALDKVNATSDNSNNSNTEGNEKMTIKQKAANTANSLVNLNVDAAKNAAFISMGTVANTLVAEKVAPHMPLIIRGQAKKPTGRLLMANVFAAGVKQFAPENEKLALVADAMVNEAMLSVFNGFDIEGLTKQLLEATSGQLETLTGQTSQGESK
jgi:hypothetical protein